MALIMTALGSAMLIASHALPDDGSQAATTVDGAEAAERLAEELCSAKWITERTPTALTFTVPDRNGDGLPERIRYAWSGSSGDPLTRSYNGASSFNVLADVREFALSYDTVAVDEEYSGAPVESAEQLLSSHAGSVDLKNFSIDQDKWIGQHFTPPLDPNAVSWKVTRVLFEAEYRGATDGRTAVQLRPADPNDVPTDTVLEEHVMYESDLSNSYTWQEFSFSDVTGLSPTDGLCLVLQFETADNHSATIQYDNDGGLGRLDTHDAGAIWGYTPDKAMRHYVYGTYMTPGPPQTATRYYVTGVNITLRAGDEPTSRVVTAVQTLNTPELLSDLWEAYFDSDPTLDHNGDGNNDWIASRGNFNEDALIDGVWYADDKIVSSPDSDFVGLTTIHLCFRDTSADGQGAVFMVNADRSGGLAAVFLVQIILGADATQTLTICNQQADLMLKTLKTVTGLSSGFVTLRLLIDPGLDTVNIAVDGTDQGTDCYTRITPINDYPYAMVYYSGGSVEFDYVTIRVSE